MRSSPTSYARNQSQSMQAVPITANNGEAAAARAVAVIQRPVTHRIGRIQRERRQAQQIFGIVSRLSSSRVRTSRKTGTATTKLRERVLGRDGSPSRKQRCGINCSRRHRKRNRPRRNAQVLFAASISSSSARRSNNRSGPTSLITTIGTTQCQVQLSRQLIPVAFFSIPFNPT